MGKFRVVFFSDKQVPEHQLPVRTELGKKGFTCLESRTPDEFSQTFHQSGKFAVVFSDAKDAVTFMQTNSKELVGLEFKAYVYLSKNGKFSGDSLKILENNRINPFALNEQAQLLQSIDAFFSDDKTDVLNIDDIQFLMPKDD